jgi:hypothetical protein
VSPVTLALLQGLATAVLVFALWWLWRMCVARASGDRWLLLIVAAGFLGRALLGQALFWISWLGLPFLRSLQLGNGFWFFAQDSVKYLHRATRLLELGDGVFTLHTQFPAHTFTELLWILVTLCGSVASVAILLNCAAYLGMCALILRMGSSGRLPRMAALLAVSFAPGAVLWSLQPLKDSLFLFLIVAVVAAFSAWQERLQGRRLGGIGAAVAVVVGLYALAGMRWYFAAIVWGVSALFFVLTALPSQRRWRAMAWGASFFVFLAGVVRVGGSGDIVPFLQYAERSLRGDAQIGPPIRSLPAYVAQIRGGFENTPGATTIGAGTAIVGTTAIAAEESTSPTAAAPTATTVAAAPPRDRAPTPSEATPTLSEAAPPPAEATAPPTEAATTPSDPAPTRGDPAPTRGHPAPPAPLAEAQASAPPRSAGSVPAPAATAVPEPAEAAPVAAPQETEPLSAFSEPVLPRSTRARLITGAAATFLPRALAQWAGLIDVRGGRGLWLFVELDTLAFDAVVLFALVYCSVMLIRRRARVTPLFVMFVLVFAVTAIPMMYSISNFGTLFRLRQILYVLAAVLPLTLAYRGLASASSAGAAATAGRD